MSVLKLQKMQKVLVILIMAIMVASTLCTVVLASDTTPSQITGEAGSVQNETIINGGKQIVYILQTVGIVLSVIVLIVIGIKYMMGSAEEKAEYKKTFMPYIIGAALIFAASVFAQVAYDFFTGITA